jgi:hypothetical protein
MQALEISGQDRRLSVGRRRHGIGENSVTRGCDPQCGQRPGHGDLKRIEVPNGSTSLNGQEKIEMSDITLADFRVLVRRAGLTLTDAQVAELHGVWRYVEGMAARNRTPALAREAEPAVIFKPLES